MLEDAKSTANLAERFFARFAGLERAHGRYTVKPAPSGEKAQGDAVTIKTGGATAELWARHLAGNYGLGIIPIRDDATCVWGAIDIDVYKGLDHVALDAECQQLRLPLVVCKSKSGGAHLYLFLKEPAPAELVRNKLSQWALALGRPGVEIFPKQTTLAGPDDFGNWLNVPYFGGASSGRHAVRDGHALSQEAFLNLADERAVTAQQLAIIVPSLDEIREPIEEPLATHELVDADAQTVRDALTNIPSDDYFHWIRVGFALKRKFGDEGFELWDSWSKTTPEKYDGEHKLRKWWDGLRLRESGVTIGTIFFWAREAGWTGSTQAWPPLIDITADDDLVPPFPTRLLPEPFSEFIVDVADRMQVPADFIAIPLLVATATMIGRDFRLKPKRHDDWTERACLWGMMISPPGEKKSPAADEALRCIHKMQKEKYEEWKVELEAWKSADKKDAGPEPRLETVVTHEATVEALVSVMDGDKRGFMLYRDELSGWMRGQNKYRQRGGDDRQFYLQCWSGGSYRTDRKTTGVIYLDDLYLSIFGGTQPGIVQELLKGGDVDGMTARFQLMVYPRLLENKDFVDREPNYEARKAVENRLRAIRDHQPFEGVGVLRFSGAAQMVVDKWMHKTECRKISDDAFCAHVKKYTGLFARLALVLHFMTHGDKVPDEVSEDTARAVQSLIDDYLEPHARRIYRHLAAHPARAGAVRIAHWIRKERVKHFTIRNIRRHNWKEFSTERDENAIVSAIEHLEAHGWVRIEEHRPGKRGGRPSLKVIVNPEVSAVSV